VDAQAARLNLVGAAIRWCALSVAWAGVVGAISLVAGISAGSVALIGFALDALVDAGVSATLVWRFRHERMGTRPSDDLERQAAIIVGVVLLLIAVYLGIRAAVSLIGETQPEPSTVGIALTAASLVVLPVLSRAKLRLSVGLESQVLRADGVLSGADAALAAATLLALAANAALNWWWADSIAAFLIGATLFREGIATLRSR
jgi:divalent metal cation (Fe/Co/Zn/Cd) transporter